jgi:hypothetical protein
MEYAKAYQRPVRRDGIPLLGRLPGVAHHRWHMVREDSRSAVSVAYALLRGVVEAIRSGAGRLHATLAEWQKLVHTHECAI